MRAFSIEEKCHLFDEISKLYFAQNFGSTSKADFETLIFSELIEHQLNSNDAIDDYTLSKLLGITQSRIRTLKERKELKYPHKGFEWKAAFADEIRNAKYDSSDHYIKVIVQDINVMNEVRHYIESHGWYDECSLNKKLLRIPLDCFADVFLENTELEKVFSDDVKKKLKSIQRKNSGCAEYLKDFTKDGLKDFLMIASKEVICDAIKLLPFGGVAKIAFDYLTKILEGE